MSDGRWRTTFRLRLTVATTLLCLGVLVTAGSVVYWTARQALRASLDASLLGIARVETASVRAGTGDARNKPPAALVLTAGTGYEKFAQVENSADKIIARTDNLLPVSSLPGNQNQEAAARAGHIILGEMILHGVPLRAIYYPFQDTHRNHLLAVIAIPEEPMHRALHTLLESIIFSLLVAGGLAAVGANRLARRLTVPLEQMAAASRSVGGSNLKARIPTFSPDAELQEVTGVLNEMLTRLESAFTAQARFVADASHELRSPLSNLRGTVEVALRRPRSPEEYQQTLRTSLVEIERLSRLASDLLTLSRADTGRFVVNLGLCDLACVAYDTVSAHEVRAQEQQIHLHLDIQESLPIWGDPDRLRQVLDNLLDNALRHAPTHSTITVKAERDADVCIVLVSDSGPGLSDEDQKRIFDRFYRADSSRARQFGGAGLGLAIARAIAEAHEGQISVLSSPGTGAVFALSIPAVSADI